MKTSLKAGLSAERKKELESDFKSSVFYRQRMKELCAKKIEALRSELRTKESYDSPSWAYRQADLMGYERALHEVMSLLEE